MPARRITNTFQRACEFRAHKRSEERKRKQSRFRDKRKIELQQGSTYFEEKQDKTTSTRECARVCPAVKVESASKATRSSSATYITK